MSVNPNKIDLAAATKQAADKILPVQKIGAPSTDGKIDLAAATRQAAETLKKKEQTQSVTTPPALPNGAVIPTSESPLSEPDVKGFTDNDSNTLNTLLSKHNVVDANNPFANVRKNMGLQEIPVVEKVSKRPFINEYEKASTLVNSLKQDVDKMEATQMPVFIPGAPGMTAHMASKQSLTNEQKQKVKDLEEAQNIKKKAWRELTIEGEGEIDAIVRTDQSGNLLKKTFNRLLATNPNSSALAAAAISSETVDKINKLPSQFVTGLNYLKGVEPVIYERVTESLAKGMPLSETQVANITAQGLDIEEERLKRDISAANKKVAPDVKRLEDMSNQLKSIKPVIDSYEQKVKQLQLTPQEITDYKDKVNEYNALVKEAKPLEEKVSGMMGGYSKKAEELSDVRKKNLVDNEEVLRAFLSDGIAEMGDEIGKATQAGNVVRPEAQVAGFMFGHTWNYDDAEIKKYGEQYAKKNGLDPTSPQVQKAIKYLQDNEGVMVMENSIAKAGGIRELFKGAAEPIRGVSNFVEDLGKSSNDTYIESQSQGNVNVSEKRLKSEDTGVRGVLNEVLKGTGQFASQAGLMYATGAPLGALGKTLMGSNLGASTAGELVGALPNVGKAVMAAKNPMAVFTTSYAMAYDSNLKNALNYTSDNSLAKKAAAFNSTLEGATELFLSPLDIATGIVKKFTKGQTEDLLKIFAEKSLKDTPNKLTEYATKFIKGVLGTSKVAGAEIGEEMVTQIADFATNAYLNPNSESFKNRDLANELMTTAYQTGLTMAIPALLNGIGASRANTFSKGSLMVAAQNRQKMIDAYNQDFANGKIDQNQLNGNISLINTAAQANAELPKKIDGRALTTNEKADYIFSRVTEAMLQNKANRVNDAAEKQILNKQIIQQQNYRAAILGNEKIEEEPVYKVDKSEVSKEQFVQAAESENSNDHEFEVTGDEEVKQHLQNTDAEIKRKQDAVAAELTDDELVKQVEDKKIAGYEKTSIDELKQQSLQAPDSFKNQFGDEELTVTLIAKNSEKEIEDAIKYQQDRLSDPDIDEAGIEGVDKHIQLLEKGLKQKSKIDELKKSIPEKQQVVIDEPNKSGESKGKDVVGEEGLKPIKQLGSGANVYFETNKYRVNDDLKNGGIFLNIGDKNGEVPLANIKFTDANEAVFVAKKLEENAPEGLVSDFHNVDKIIENYKQEFKEQSLSLNKEQAVNEKQATEISNPKEKGNTPNEGTDKKGGTAKSKIAKFKEKHIKKDDSTTPAKSDVEPVPKDDTESKGQADKEPVQQNPDETGQPDAVDVAPVLNEAETIEAEKKQKIEQLTAEKQQRVNEVTKPEISFDFGLSIDDLVNTSAANRSEVEESKSKLASLKNIINCLWA